MDMRNSFLNPGQTQPIYTRIKRKSTIPWTHKHKSQRDTFKLGRDSNAQDESQATTGLKSEASEVIQSLNRMQVEGFVELSRCCSIRGSVESIIRGPSKK